MDHQPDFEDEEDFSEIRNNVWDEEMEDWDRPSSRSPKRNEMDREEDDRDERPLSRIDDDDDRDDDEPERERDEPVPRKIKPKKVGPVNHVILSADILAGPKGIEKIGESFKDFKFGGKGSEKSDLDRILHKLEHWVHTMYPKHTFQDNIQRIEFLGNKRPVKTMVKRIRMDLVYTEADRENENNDIRANASDEENNVDFNELFDEVNDNENFDNVNDNEIPNNVNDDEIPNNVNDDEIFDDFDDSEILNIVNDIESFENVKVIENLETVKDIESFDTFKDIDISETVKDIVNLENVKGIESSENVNEIECFENDKDIEFENNEIDN